MNLATCVVYQCYLLDLYIFLYSLGKILLSASNNITKSSIRSEVLFLVIGIAVFWMLHLPQNLLHCAKIF